MGRVKVIIRDSKKTMKFEGDSALVAVNEDDKLKIVNEGIDPLVMKIIIDKLLIVFEEEMSKLLEKMINDDEFLESLLGFSSNKKREFYDKIIKKENSRVRDFFSELNNNEL